MIERFEKNALTWINLYEPTVEEIREIVDELKLPVHYLSDLTAPTPRSYATGEKGVAKVTYDIPIVKRTDVNHPLELKIIATKTHLLTVHFNSIEAVHRFQKEFEVLSIIGPNMKATGAHLMVVLMDTVYTALNEKLDYLESKLTDIEEQIFQEREKEMVFEISHVSRRTISFTHVLATHEKVLADLHTVAGTAFSKEIAVSVQRLQEQYQFLMSRIKTINETVAELRDTNIALLSTKQNEIMKTLTIMAFITFPLTLFTSMFGMNTTTAPIIGQEGDFWIILSIMGIVSIGFFAYFRYKRWL